VARDIGQIPPGQRLAQVGAGEAVDLDADEPRTVTLFATGKPLFAKGEKLKRIIDPEKPIDASSPAHGSSRWKFSAIND